TAEIRQFLESQLRQITSQGIAEGQIVLDPGVGFGKTSRHNLEILARLEELAQLGRPVCLGVSRKGFIGKLLNDRPVQRRVAASLAALCFAMSRQAVQIARVHDVEETKDAVRVYQAV